MKFLTPISLLATLTSLTSAYVTIGSSCSGNGYDCAESRDQIAVCSGSRWVVAAECGARGVCIWPAGDPAPSCITV
ncbi:uncharacterized protein BDV14DRAFT_176049 [Aspergillus stella-maris]|uniref:uncharacterized protein n=1 Tax=Aspergillus stella-maris TaxID=1810926 RepID=UPI003CCDEF25